MKIEIELDNLTEEEQKTARQLAAKKKPYFVPEEDEQYFYIPGDGLPFQTENDGCIADNNRISIGNCFRTREEAEEAKIRLQVQTAWKRMSLEAGESDNPWDKTHGHWYPCYDIVTSLIIPYVQIYLKSDSIYFPTKKNLEDAIAEIGEDNVKRYILGVTP